MAYRNFRKNSNTVKVMKRVEVPENVAKLQDNLTEAIKNYEISKILDGNLVTGLVLKSGVVNKVKHKLGRPVLGYIVVRKNAQSDIWDSQDSNKFKELTLNLHCSSNATVDLWVF